MKNKKEKQLDLEFDKLLVKLNCHNFTKLVFTDVKESELHFHRIKYPHKHKFCD